MSGRPAPLGAALRLLAFAGLALYAAVHWATMVEPAETGRMVLATGLALAAGATAYAAWSLGGARRALVVAVVGLTCAVLVLPVAGIPWRLLGPRAWDELGAGLGQGLEALPGITVPYRGIDAWVPFVMHAGGGLLLLLAALLAARSAARGTQPLGAAVALAVLYAVPVVEHAPDQPFLDGAVLALLLGALLWGHRVQRALALPAVGFVVFAAMVGLALAPRLDAAEPWIDYQGLAEDLTTPQATSFSWSHGYGPLRWPRDGRELLRITAQSGSYWKAADLDTFDGVRWRVGGVVARGIDSELPRRHRDWRQELRVVVRNLRSRQYVGAGVSVAVRSAPGGPQPSTPGTFVATRRALQRGDTYLVDAYTARPSATEMEEARLRYPPFVESYLTMDLPPVAGGPQPERSFGAPTTARLGAMQVHFPLFGDPGPAVAVDPRGLPSADADGYLAASEYGGMYALARRLRAEAPTQYAYVRAVERALAEGFTYTERPRTHRIPLPAFVFEDKAGYCQHFSGAMALLLRMGGVPSRVASGFSPGSYDSKRKEWVVRDRDAHSWVEAYFPGYGWATFDPTPQEAPARGQLARAGTPAAANAVPLTPPSTGRDTPADPAAAAVQDAAATDAGGGRSPVLIGVLALLGVTLAGAVAVAVALGRRPHPPAWEVAELERALRRTGRPVAPPLTLSALEGRFTRDAAAYVAAVRAARYAGAGERPTTAQRAALRRALAEGLGPLGRLRAWWALPPRGYLHSGR